MYTMCGAYILFQRQISEIVVFVKVARCQTHNLIKNIKVHKQREAKQVESISLFKISRRFIYHTWLNLHLLFQMNIKQLLRKCLLSSVYDKMV